MSNKIFDPKMYTHVSSDKDKTVLKHKQGHTITIAHNAISPKMRQALSALADVSSHSPDDYSYGKVIQKAEGGGIHPNHKPYSPTHFPDEEKATKGMSRAGVIYRQGDETSKETAKRIHERKLQELRNSPKPKLADGGQVPVPNQQGDQQQPQPSQQEKPVGANVNTPSSLEELGNRIKNAWAEGGFIQDMIVNGYAEGGDIAEEPTFPAPNSPTKLAQGGNAGEQRKKAFGKQSSPGNKDMREKHIQHIKKFARNMLAIDINPSGGKINEKTGQRRDKDAEIGVDKPDWRSGQLESQWNPDAMMHELAHVALMPMGIGLKEGQRLMDKQYAQVQKEHGYMKQKRSQHEVQPMAAEQILRRHLGLPANQNSVPVEDEATPRTSVEDPNVIIGTRVRKGNKTVDLIRQSRFLTPENRQRLEDIMTGKLKFHPDYGWQINPDALGAKVELYKQQNPKAVKKMAAGGPMVMDSGSDPNFAYEHGMPCKNPSCKSHGRPHPNCRCYSFAEGGEVQHVCGINLGHYPDCEHYVAPKRMAEGGLSDLGMDSGITPWSKRKAAPSDGLADPSSSVDQTIGHLFGADANLPQNTDVAQNDQTPDVHPDMDVAGTQPQPEQMPSPMIQPGMPGTPEGDAAMQMAQPQQAAPAPQPVPAQPQAPTAAPAPVKPLSPRSPAAGTAVDQPQMAQPQYQVPTPKEQATQAMIDEAKAWQNDLNNGHITPKTYNDLMYYNKDGAEKSTLGKIGSIFGVLMSGAGSGLAHQDNMALKMMDNTIKRDLDAQMKSKDNARSSLKLEQERMLNNANIKNILESASYTNAQKQAVFQGIQQKAYAIQYMRDSYTAIHKLQDMVQSLPQGSPQRQQAEQKLLWLSSMVDKNNAMVASAAVTSLDNLGSMAGFNGGGHQDSEQAFQDQQNMLRMSGTPENIALAERNEATHLRGVPGKATAPLGAKKDMYQAADTFNKRLDDLIHFAEQNQSFKTVNMLSQKGRELNKVANQKVEELLPFYNSTLDGLGLTNGRTQYLAKQLQENPQSHWSTIMGNLAQLKEIRNSSGFRLQNELHNLGFDVPDPAKHQQMSGQAPKGQTIERLDPKSGRTVIYDAKTLKPLRWK